MQHVAIMKRSLGYLDKIKDGTKTVESRWYLFKRSPWNRISKGDTIFFKNSGMPVDLRCKASKILQFDNLSEDKVRSILDKYSVEIGIEDKDDFYEGIKDKKYCILIFLENMEDIDGFEIDKKGFGLMSAWMSLDDIDKIKK